MDTCSIHGITGCSRCIEMTRNAQVQLEAERKAKMTPFIEQARAAFREQKASNLESYFGAPWNDTWYGTCCAQNWINGYAAALKQLQERVHE